MKKKKMPALCPCGSLLDYKDCCGRFHDGDNAPDALSLMKSRYSAFVKGRADYLLRTWHSSTRPSQLDLSEPVKWLGLEIVSFEGDAKEATVSFIARGKINGRAFKQVETSRFVREGTEWFYVDGVVSQ